MICDCPCGCENQIQYEGACVLCEDGDHIEYDEDEDDFPDEDDEDPGDYDDEAIEQ